MRFAVNDGPGVRTTAFLKGCSLRCAWCHNPESQEMRPELVVRPELCIGCGRCRTVCPAWDEPRQGPGRGDGTPAADHPPGCLDCGRCAAICSAGAREIAGYTISAAGLVERMRRDVVFYDQSGGGVTFSGGEPLCQPGLLLASLKLCRERGLRSAVDTSGQAPWEVLGAVAEITDLFLYDLKLMDCERHRVHTGAGNQLILCNLAELSRMRTDIIVRIPVIPGVNDDPGNAREAAAFLSRETRVKRVALLAYHAAGEAKYRRLGRPLPMPATTSPGPGRLRELGRIYEAAGLAVTGPEA